MRSLTGLSRTSYHTLFAETKPQQHRGILAPIQLTLLAYPVMEALVHAALHLDVVTPVHLRHRLRQEHLGVKHVLLRRGWLLLQVVERELHFPRGFHYHSGDCNDITLLGLKRWRIHRGNAEGIGVLLDVFRDDGDGAD